MAELLRMPEVAAGVESVILSTWSVAENTPFSAQDVIAVLETDKAVVDVEAETDGVILRRLVADGTDVPVGDPIALIAAPDETVDIDAALAQLGYASAPSTATDSPSPEVTDAEPSSAPPAVTVGDVEGPTGSVHHGRLFASPLARRMARQAGLAIESITGTGPGGRIIRRDVENALATSPSTPAPSTPLPLPVPAPTSVPIDATTSARTPSGTTGAAFTDTPHTRLRRAIAARLTGSKQTAPHFYLRGTARVDRLLALREELNSGEATRVSVNDLVIKAVARAHTALPAFNVIWTPDAIRSFETVDICVAIATDNGLVTPVLRSVEQTSITTIAATVKDYAQRARAGRLQQSELEGGVISITNLGMLGTEEFSAIINPPQSAILAVGAARQEPVVTGGILAVGTVMRVTLSVDHRPVDGVIAAQWMRILIGLLENPAKILA